MLLGSGLISLQSLNHGGGSQARRAGCGASPVGSVVSGVASALVDAILRFVVFAAHALFEFVNIIRCVAKIIFLELNEVPYNIFKDSFKYNNYIKEINKIELIDKSK